MYIAAAQVKATPRGQILMSTETSCHFSHLLHVSKTSIWSDFIHIFFISYIAPGQGLTTPWGQNLMSTGTSCHFGHLLQVSKKISLKSDFIHFFILFYTCI